MKRKKNQHKLSKRTDWPQTCSSWNSVLDNVMFGAEVCLPDYILLVRCLVTQSCLTLCDLMNCSLPGSSVHGDSPGKNTGVGCHALFQGIFPTHGSNPGLLHCRWILYCLSHQGSPRILECVAYPFSRGFSQPRNRTGVFCITDGFFTRWATRDTYMNLKMVVYSLSLLKYGGRTGKLKAKMAWNLKSSTCRNHNFPHPNWF